MAFLGRWHMAPPSFIADCLLDCVFVSVSEGGSE